MILNRTQEAGTPVALRHQQAKLGHVEEANPGTMHSIYTENGVKIIQPQIARFNLLGLQRKSY